MHSVPVIAPSEFIKKLGSNNVVEPNVLHAVWVVNLLGIPTMVTNLHNGVKTPLGL